MKSPHLCRPLSYFLKTICFITFANHIKYQSDTKKDAYVQNYSDLATTTTTHTLSNHQSVRRPTTELLYMTSRSETISWGKVLYDWLIVMRGGQQAERMWPRCSASRTGSSRSLKIGFTLLKAVHDPTQLAKRKPGGWQRQRPLWVSQYYIQKSIRF